jgi:HEAT repeat protein
VALYVPTRDPSNEDIRDSLEGLVRNFEPDAPANRKLIRDIFDSDREIFYRSAIDILRTASDSRGVQYLVALMVANGMLVRALCEPSLSRDQALSLARSAIRVDPLADAMLARKLADSAMGQGESIVDQGRTIDILSEIADAARVLPSLMRLLRHSNPYLRSKVVKMIGQGSRSTRWVRAKLAESDPRVRANAVEAIWGVDSIEARTLLHFAANDDNNRVTGNALLGLYYLGDCSALKGLIKMSGHESSLFRATAAWVMGQTGDVRFSDVLRRLLMERESVVRRRALVALGRIKQATDSCVALPQLHVAARFAPGSRLKGSRRIMAAVAADGSKEPPRVGPLHFLLSEDNQYITSYSVTEKPEPEAMSVIWVIPRTVERDLRPFQEAALNCLKWKRPSDLWCVLPYLQSADEGLGGHVQELPPPQFTANAETAEALLKEPAKRIDCTDLWTALWRATQAAAPSRGQRHVIVFSRSPESRIAGYGLASNAQSRRYPILVVSSVENPELQEFCRLTYSSFALAVPQEIPEIIRRAYLSLQARYEITYRPVNSYPCMLKLRVQSAEGCGETLVSAPQSNSPKLPAGVISGTSRVSDCLHARSPRGSSSPSSFLLHGQVGSC